MSRLSAQNIAIIINFGARMGGVAQNCTACWATREARDVLDDLSLVQNPKVTVLALGRVAGSTLKIRVTGEVPNFFGVDGSAVSRSSKRAI